MRQFKGYRGCTTRGVVSLDDFNICEDKTCPSCNLMREALKDAIKAYEINMTDYTKDLLPGKGSTTFQIVLNKDWYEGSKLVGRFEEYKDKVDFDLEETNGYECMNFQYVSKFKIPFDYRYLRDGDRIENQTGESLYYFKQDNAYRHVNNDVDKFLSDSMIYQEWKKVE